MLYGYDQLIQLIADGAIKIKNEKERARYLDGEGVSACNCDLCIGPECYISAGRGSTRNGYTSYGIVRICKSRGAIIPPMGIMLFETDAEFKIPNNCAFRLSLRMKYLKKGLIMSNQPLGQPGYSGRMFGIIMNISNKGVEIKYKEPMLTLEAMAIAESVGRPKERDVTTKMTMERFASETICSSFYEELIDIKKTSRKAEIRYKKARHIISRHSRRQMGLLTLSSFIVTLVSVIIGLYTMGWLK